MFNSGQSLLVHHEGELIDVLRHGQGVMSVMDLGELADELDGAITLLRTSTGTLAEATGTRVSA